MIPRISLVSSVASKENVNIFLTNNIMGADIRPQTDAIYLYKSLPVRDATYGIFFAAVNYIVFLLFGLSLFVFANSHLDYNTQCIMRVNNMCIGKITGNFAFQSHERRRRCRLVIARALSLFQPFCITDDD